MTAVCASIAPNIHLMSRAARICLRQIRFGDHALAHLPEFRPEFRFGGKARHGLAHLPEFRHHRLQAGGSDLRSHGVYPLVRSIAAGAQSHAAFGRRCIPARRLPECGELTPTGASSAGSLPLTGAAHAGKVRKPDLAPRIQAHNASTKKSILWHADPPPTMGGSPLAVEERRQCDAYFRRCSESCRRAGRRPGGRAAGVACRALRAGRSRFRHERGRRRRPAERPGGAARLPLGGGGRDRRGPRRPARFRDPGARSPVSHRRGDGDRRGRRGAVPARVERDGRPLRGAGRRRAAHGGRLRGRRGPWR